MPPTPSPTHNRTREVPNGQAIAKTSTLIAEPVSVIIAPLARIIHESSWRDRRDATRDGRAEPRRREAYL